VSTVEPIKAYIAISEQEYIRFGGTEGRAAETIPLELILADGTVYPHKGRFSLADRQVDVKTGTMRIGALFPTPATCCAPASSPSSGRPWRRRRARFWSRSAR